MAKTIYLNLEDDVTKVINKLKREKTAEVVLVFPKQSFLFSDSINMRLLKKQIDMLGKKAYILTMDEKGQMYAQEAGFELKFLPKTSRAYSISDIRPRRAVAQATIAESVTEASEPVAQVKSVVRKSKPQKITTTRRTTTGLRKQATAVAVRADNMFVPPSKEDVKLSARKSYRNYVVGFIALSLIILLLLVLVILPSATVTVFAKSQVVSRDMDIIADINTQSVDAARLTIPATTVQESQSLTDTFQSQGKKEVGSKAQGRVAIYNLTGSPINLKASTTTLTVGSKTYTFNGDQSGLRALPSANEDTNASIADITAVEGGESFNLPAGTRMEITNQAFGSQPQRLYAKTVSQVVGGSSRFISVISKDDLAKAQDTLVKKLIEGINSKLQGQNVSLVEGAYTVAIESFTSDKPQDTEAPTFAAELRVNISGLAFNENSLKDMVRQRLLMSLGSNKSLQESRNDTIVYKIKNIDTTAGVMQLSLHYESKALPVINAKEVTQTIAGKGKTEASELILTNPDVDRVEISVQPVWQASLPRFGSKIKLEVKE